MTAINLLGMAREELARGQGSAGVHVGDSLVEAIDERPAKIAAARTADEDEAEATGEADWCPGARFLTYRVV